MGPAARAKCYLMLSVPYGDVGHNCGEGQNYGSDPTPQNTCKEAITRIHHRIRPADMDITKSVVAWREAALLYGDYSTYWTQLSHKLLNSRKKLNIATKKRGQFHPKAAVTAEQIGENHE